MLMMIIIIISRAAETQRWVESSSERYGARADEPEEAKAKARPRYCYL